MQNETKENKFDRGYFLKKTKMFSEKWDIIIIGGGATGLGTAVDAASRGFKTLLLEQGDFANGTSSRSTKLAHGGVRYLAQGNISLVYEALYERGLMLKNAPHLVKILAFVIPGYHWWEKHFYGVGLKIYDWMSRRLRLNKTKYISSETICRILPGLKHKGLKGGILYYDGQFDDSRLAINLAQTSAENGGVLLNYMKVVSLQKDEQGKVSGVLAQDVEGGEIFRLNSKVVINATGVFADNIMGMDSIKREPIIKASQGIHIVLDSSFFKGDTALMIPSTKDGRVLFAIPWHGHVLAGTTDTPKDHIDLEPVALQSEVDFILATLGEYLERKPATDDILSVFAGLRPLVMPSNEKGTKSISRDHKLLTSSSQLITITGGKWTTYRKMAEEAVDEAIQVGNLENRSCVTQELKIHGYKEPGIGSHFLDVYGSDSEKILALAEKDPELGEKLHPEFPNIMAEVVWVVRNEMARSIEDVLARRLRILFLNARAAIDMAPKVGSLLAQELHLDREWQKRQVQKFNTLAQNYLLEPYQPLVIKEKTKI